MDNSTQQQDAPMPAESGWDFWDVPFFSPWVYLQHPWMLLQHPLALLLLALWIWMLVYCARHDPERGLWLWILVIFNIPAAAIYFFIRWLPGARISGFQSLVSRWSRRGQLPRLEAAARNIGNAHQYVELGEAYRELGRIERAAECFGKALERDPGHLPALWGAAQVELQRNNAAPARGHLEQILSKDPMYKFGDVSLAYCRALVSLNEADTAKTCLEQHVKRWTHPEAYVLLATILIERGEHPQARAHLEATLLDLRAGPAFFARQNRSWARKARRLLARLPRSA
jgi:hypothetical protein